MSLKLILTEAELKKLVKSKKNTVYRPIDFRDVFQQTGCRRGSLKWSVFLNSWAVFDGDTGVDLCEIKCPFGKSGDMITQDGVVFEVVRVRIVENNKWAFELRKQNKK